MRSLFVALTIVLTAAPAFAQPQQHGDSLYQPHVAQPGKDVIWVPTPDDVVERMLRMAEVSANDLVYDLGAGDGKIAIMAAKKFGARSVGIEFNPDMAAYAQRNAQREGVADRAQIRRGDIFATDFSNATVVTLFLLPSLNQKLRPTLLQMRPGTRIVSHAFDMDDWKPDEVSRPDGRIAYLWIVPASVQGRWTVTHSGSSTSGPFEADLTQTYQRIEGDANFGPKLRVSVNDGVVRGDEIRFSLRDAGGVRHEYNGRLSSSGKLIQGNVRSGEQSGTFRMEKR